MSNRSSRFTWQYIHLVLFGLIPVIILNYGLNSIIENREQLAWQGVLVKKENELQILKQYLKTEEFLTQYIGNSFIKAAKSNNPNQIMAEQRQKVNHCFDYIIWHRDYGVLGATVNPNTFKGDWNLFWNTTFQKCIHDTPHARSFTEEEIINYRTLLGPQIILDQVFVAQNHHGLIQYTDSIGVKPLVWLNSDLNNSLRIVCFIRPEELKKYIGLEYYLQHEQRKSTEIKYNAIIDGRLILQNASDKILENYDKLLLNKKQEVETESGIYSRIFQSKRIEIFAFTAKDFYETNKYIVTLINLLIVVIFILPWLYIIIREKIAKKPIYFSIAKKLSLLYVYANRLPLAMLFFIGFNYMAQKELLLYDNMHSKGINYIQNFDERLESEYLFQLRMINKSLEPFIDALLVDGLTYKNYTKLLRGLNITNHKEQKLYLVSTSDNSIGTAWFLTVKSQNYDFNIKEPRGKDDDSKMFGKLLTALINTINGTGITSRQGVELEFVAEALAQTSLLEIENEFIAKDGDIFPFNLKKREFLIFNKLISDAKDEKIEYSLAITWLKRYLEQLYIERQILNANRNLDGLRLVAIDALGRVYPASFADTSAFKKHLVNLDANPNASRQFVEYDGKQYLFMGIQSKKMSGWSLIGLYPASNIVSLLKKEQTYFFVIGITSLLLALLLGNFLLANLLEPIKKLTSGAIAITKRRFDERLPHLGNDEFGAIAKIFNETMVDFEELEVAGAIQTNLLPTTSLEKERFNLFAKIFSDNSLSGNYYDYFANPDESTALIVGYTGNDGVSAALTMGIIKAGLIDKDDLLNKPDELFLCLNGLIRDIHDSTKPFVSLQYMYLLPNSDEAKCIVAGDATIMLVAHNTKKIDKFALAGDKLGAKENPNFATIDLTLASNTSLILCNNKDYIELIEKNALKCFNPNPSIYLDSLNEAIGAKTTTDCALLILILQ